MIMKMFILDSDIMDSMIHADPLSLVSSFGFFLLSDANESSVISFDASAPLSLRNYGNWI